MKENFEAFQKFSPEDVKFFNGLAEKYGLEQDEERLIVSRNGKRAFILKRKKIAVKRGGKIQEADVEDLIKEAVEKLEKSDE